MPDSRDTSDDVSGLFAVSSQSPELSYSEGLHRSRAYGALKGSAIGTAVAIGAVFGARQLAPSLMLAGEKQTAKLIEQLNGTPNLGEASQEAARKTLNTALMLTSGLVSNVSSQLFMVRKRRDGYAQEQNVPVTRDVTRLLTGWSFGSFGASAAYYLAERYGARSMKQSEKLLDYALKGFEYAPSNRLSEAIVANVVMSVGAIPVNVVGQRLYDAALEHPAYVKEH